MNFNKFCHFYTLIKLAMGTNYNPAIFTLTNMGPSISKDKQSSIPQNCLKFIEPFLLDKNIGANLSYFNEFRKPIITHIKDESTIDQFILENISSKLFVNNETSGNFRSLSLFFIEVLLEYEKELYISVENKKMRIDDQIAKINNLIGLGTIIKFIIIHYLKNFGVDTLIKSLEHTPFVNFVYESKNQDKNYKELKRHIELEDKCNEQETINCQLNLFLYVCKSLKFSREYENSSVSFEDLSVFERFFSSIPSFLVSSQKYVENANSPSEINNSLIELQNILMDILLILFLPNIKDKFNAENDYLYIFITCFQLYSSFNSVKNVYCEEELDSFQNKKYLFLQYLIKKAFYYKQTCKLFEVNREKSILLLSTIMFNPPGLKLNIYSEWINNFSDPRFIPDSLISSDSNTDSDLDTNQYDFSNFPYFEQAYRSVILGGILMKYHLSIFLLYSLVHSNSHFISYCYSRADPDALLLALMEPIYIISKKIDETYLSELTALLSIILRLTSDSNLCKALNNTKIDGLPLWLEEDSLKKVIHKCDSYIEKNEFETSERNSISIGNILLLVLLRTMFYNYKSNRDVYLCIIIYSIIENISIDMQNFHWNVAEKLIHYIIFLSSQIYCSLNTYNGDMSNIGSFNRFYCGILMHKSLLKLIVESIKDENLQSNADLIYMVIKFSLIAETKKLHIFLKKCIYNYKTFDSQATILDKYLSLTPVAEILKSIVEFYELIETVSKSFENEIINMDNISATENIYEILQTIQNIILSKKYLNQKICEISKHATFRRNHFSEFKFYFRAIYYEYWRNCSKYYN